MPPSLADSDLDVVGEALESGAALEGLEVSEQDVRRAKMLEQINDMANTTPEEAAALVRKWVRTDAA